MPFVKMMPHGHKPTVRWLWSILLWFLECHDIHALTHWQQCLINGRGIQRLVIQQRYFIYSAVRCCPDQQFHHSWKNSFLKWLTQNDQCSVILVTYCVIYTLGPIYTLLGTQKMGPRWWCMFIFCQSIEVFWHCWWFSAVADYIYMLYRAWLPSPVSLEKNILAQ